MAFEIRSLPFHLGYMDVPRNPKGLPSTLDFCFDQDVDSGLVRQVVSDRVSSALSLVYSLGHEIGTPLAGEGAGLPYLSDFRDFVVSGTRRDARVLEIGVGRGHLTHMLGSSGRDTIGIEPGKGYSKEWEQLGIRVVQDFFPSSKITGKFDAVVAYAVLEHAEQPIAFLESIRAVLKPGGQVFLAVPDCSAEVFYGDPSMFIHEHVSYFTGDTLRSVASRAGFEATVVESGFGRSLYLQGRISIPSPIRKSSADVPLPGVDMSLRFSQKVKNVRAALRLFGREGPVGVFCPGRALPFLEQGAEYRFFDDDVRLWGKFLPPFEVPIEGRRALFDEPMHNLLICSRTFGDQIADELVASGFQGQIHKSYGENFDLAAT